MHGNPEDASRTQNRFNPPSGFTHNRHRWNQLSNYYWSSEYPFIASVYGNDWSPRIQQHNFFAGELFQRFTIIGVSAAGFGWGFGELIFCIFFDGG